MTHLDYGIIGNCRTAALVSKTGAIEWLCFPMYDSASVFAKILDTEKGGSFEFITSDDYKCSQKYIPNTNILVTSFSNGADSFEVIDFMPRYYYRDQKQAYSRPMLSGMLN